MSLFDKWQERVEASRSNQNTYQEFWNKYFDLETEVYRSVLKEHETVPAGTLAVLAEKYHMEPETFIGYLDGANTSFASGEKNLSELTEESEVVLDFDFEKLYFNMHEAKADWLYNLSEWEAVLPEEKRQEITKAYRASKIFIREAKIGRNDPCPCGSGKKYKNCCGKNA